MSAAKAKRIYLVDDDVEFRRSMRALLSVRGFTAVAEFDDGQSFLHAAPRLASGVVLLDMNMPRLSGQAILRELQHFRSRFATIVMTGWPDVRLAVEAMQKGAFNFLEKGTSAERTLRIVEAALATIEGAGRAIQNGIEARARVGDLTPRERDVLNFLIEGKSTKQISEALGTSVRTVEKQRASLIARLGANSLPEAIYWAALGGCFNGCELTK